MLVPQNPSLKLRLRPGFDEDNQAIHIDVHVSFETRARAAGETLLRHVLEHNGATSQQYDSASITAWSPLGTVKLHARDGADGRVREFYCAQRLRAQRLVIRYRALPVHTDETAMCGPQVTLQQDGGGLSGAGMGFLLMIAEDELDYQIAIEWDLSSAPGSTRAVSTWGEGDTVTLRDNPVILGESFFMVGPVRSYPAQPGSEYGMYWLSQPPFDAVRIGQTVESLLPRARAFFEDPNPLFRVFTRRNYNKCVSGMGLYRAFVFGWNTIQPRTSDLTDFLVHEMVHNWPRLEASNPPTHAQLADGWFNEGIADYYALVLLYRCGVFDEDAFVSRLNQYISGYYTNPVRGTPNAEIPDRFWTPGRYNRVPYQRGFMYFVRLAWQLQQQAGGRSLDDLIREMVMRRRNYQPHSIDVWLQLVETELGSRAQDDYRNMAAGKLIHLPKSCMDAFIPNARWTLRRCDQEEFQLGFPEACLASGGDGARTITDLDPNSRAARAGVRDGDHVTPHSSYLFDAEIWDNCFQMGVLRDGREEVLEWWPRSWEKVESYQFCFVGRE